jgi:hypothetical protein
MYLPCAYQGCPQTAKLHEQHKTSPIERLQTMWCFTDNINAKNDKDSDEHQYKNINCGALPRCNFADRLVYWDMVCYVA